jgi:hypothetical protein
MNNENTKGKYFLPSLPAVSAIRLLIKLNPISAATCMREGYKSSTELVFLDFRNGTVKKIMIKTVVIVIHKEEFVKEISYPNNSRSIKGLISNCLRGLSPLAMR